MPVGIAKQILDSKTVNARLDLGQGGKIDKTPHPDIPLGYFMGFHKDIIEVGWRGLGVLFGKTRAARKHEEAAKCDQPCFCHRNCLEVEYCCSHASSFLTFESNHFRYPAFSARTTCSQHPHNQALSCRE